jgi:hypothetical protein
MTETTTKALTSAVLRLLRPLVRILLRNGMSFNAFAELARWTYVDVAEREFGLPGRKQSASRVSVITGLTRKEVARLAVAPPPDDEMASGKYNRAARVLTGWLRDPRFTAEGEPIELAIEGDGPSFSELVRRHSGDMPVRAVLDELVRVGAVAEAGGRVRLVSRGYVPSRGELDKIHILGTDVHQLVATIDHNLQQGAVDPRFQRKVAYDNLPVEAVAEFRRLSAVRSQQLLEEYDRFLAQHDRDANPNAAGTGRKRAGVGIYYFEDDIPEER